MLLTLPNLLTLARIAAIPVVVLLLGRAEPWAAWAALAVYSAACITDWLDGYLARLRGQLSRFGRVLDPIADKLLVAACLLVLVAERRITGVVVLAALVILLREILVSGLREFLAEISVGLPVSRLAKWKTGIQMIALGVLIVGPVAPPPVQVLGEAGLWLAALLTLMTGYDYLRAGLAHMREDAPAASTSPPPGPNRYKAQVTR